MDQRNIFFIVIGVIVVLGIAGAVLFFMWSQPQTSPPPPPPLPVAPPPPVTPPPNPEYIEKDDLIRVREPKVNQLVSSPLLIRGEARGNWYFEASFPVKVLDANGKILAEIPVQAKGEWMTTNYVPFETSISFLQPTTAVGEVVLQKDNPSGLPEHDNELRIPVRFSASEGAINLYYYSVKKDKDASGNVLCSEKGLVALARKIPTSLTPIQDTMRLLLKGELSQSEKAQRISTEFPLAGVDLKGISLNSSGQLILVFLDPQNKTSGGACRVSLLKLQIEKTAKQFPEVKSVRLLPETLFQP